MRAIFLAMLLLSALLPPPAAAQAPNLSIAPTTYDWNGFSTSFAKFTVTVRNPGSQVEAYTITDITVDPNPGGMASGFYSPTPTLPLLANGQGSFHVWITGLDQATAPSGEYRVRIKVQSTIDATRAQTVEATIRRDHAPVTERGAITGSVHDARTNELPQAFEPIRVVVFDNKSVDLRPVAEGGVDEKGAFRFEVPPGEYWLMFEASGYRTTYVGRHDPLVVTVQDGPDAHIALSPLLTGRFSAEAPKVGTVNLPTYRLAASVDLTTVAVTPGAYERAPNAPGEAVVLFGAGARAHWSRNLAEPASIPIEHPSWRSRDNAVDVTKDGVRIATGSAGGQIMVHETSGTQTWKQPYTGADDVNPLVPGPLGKGLQRSSEVRFSNDGQRLAAGSLTGWVYLFDVANGTLLWKTPTAGQVRALRFDDLDERLYVGSGDNRLHALNADTGAVQWARNLQHYPAEHIAIGDGGNLIAVAGRDGILRLFDNTGRELWTRSLPGPVLGYDMTPGGNQIVAMTRFAVHSFDRNGNLQWYRGDANNSGQLRLGSANRYLAYGKDAKAGEPTIRVLDTEGTLMWEYRHDQAETIHNVRVLDDGQSIVANGASGKVYFFETWTRPPTGTRAPASSGDPEETRGRGGSPTVGLLIVAAVLVGAAVVRRRD